MLAALMAMTVHLVNRRRDTVETHGADVSSNPINNASRFEVGPPIATLDTHEVPSAFLAFNAWVGRWESAAADARAALVPDGIRLATARRTELRGLIEHDPERALRLAVPAVVRRSVPNDVAALLEERIDGRGDLTVTITCLEQHDRIDRAVRVGERRWQAFVYGRRGSQSSKVGLPIHGIAIDDVLALHSSPFRRAEPIEKRDAGLDADAPALWIGGELVPLAEQRQEDVQYRALLAAETGIGPQLSAPGTGDEPTVGTYPSFHARTPPAWTTGLKRVVVLRVDFSDAASAVIADGAITAAMSEAAASLAEMSHGRSTLTTTLVPAVLRMPQTREFYNSQGGRFDALRADAIATARTYDHANGGQGTYDLERGDRWILLFAGLNGYGASGTIGQAGVYINDAGNYSGLAGTLVHELGHNHGLLHAHRWDPTGSTPLGAGTHVEYGNGYDVMGTAVSPAGHFSTPTKAVLGYLDSAAILTVGESGVYRVYRHDHTDAAGTRALRLRVRDSDFWVEQRQLGSLGNEASMYQRLRQGVMLHWTRHPDGAGRTVGHDYLLDMTPGTVWGQMDASITVNESFTGPDGGFTITPVAFGGVAPREYVDVRVDFPPVITAHPVSRQAAIGESVSFNVTTNGTGAMYQWYRYGHPLAGATGSTLTLPRVGSNDAGAYSVLVATMQGTQWSRDALLQVGGQAGPGFLIQPQHQAVRVPDWAQVPVLAGGYAAIQYEWFRDGIAQPRVWHSFDAFPVQHDSAGLYHATATTDVGAINSRVVIVALSQTTKTAGSAALVREDIQHVNGNIYDQRLMQGAGASFTADPGQVLRVSFVDLSDDIVQVEFSGPGTLTLLLDGAGSPAPARHYNQPAVSYVKGHAAVLVTGATEATHLSIFSVGRITALDASLFRDDVDYDGMADIGYVAIMSANGRFGGLFTANASYWHTRGYTGLYAPGVQFTGAVRLGDIGATDGATPLLVVGSAENISVAGGDLAQPNARRVRMESSTPVHFVAGTDSHGAPQPAQANRARFERDELDVTAEVVR